MNFILRFDLLDRLFMYLVLNNPPNLHRFSVLSSKADQYGDALSVILIQNGKYIFRLLGTISDVKSVTFIEKAMFFPLKNIFDKFPNL